MKILIYSLYFSPDLTGNGKYSGEMATWLAQQGYKVRVVAAPPYYPAWRIHKDYASPIYRRERWRGAVVFRTPVWIPRKPSGGNRLLHLISFAITSLPVMLGNIFWRPDIVLTIAPAFICAPVGWLVARLSGAEARLHIQDFEIDVAFEMRLLKGEWLKRMTLRIEGLMFRRFDQVSSISKIMLERLSDKGVRPDRIRLFPNWVDISHIDPRLTTGRYRKELDISPDAIVAMFSGSLGEKQGLTLIPIVARLLANRAGIVIVICGDGVMKSYLESETRNLANVRHLPLQPFERLGELLCSADIHLLPQSSQAGDLVLPSKLSGMLASGRPVIATCREGTELAAIVSKCGLVVPPEDGPEMAAAIIGLAENQAARQELGHCARAWAEANLEKDAVLSSVFGVAHVIGDGDSSVLANDNVA